VSDLRPDPALVGTELPPVARVVTRADVKAYADVSGDENPLHQSDDAAIAAGFDGIIAHGMFTMGHMAAAVCGWAGPAGHVIRISAQFRASVSMGDTIVAGARVTAADPGARTLTLETWVHVDREGVVEWPVKRGEATLGFS